MSHPCQQPSRLGKKHSAEESRSTRLPKANPTPIFLKMSFPRNELASSQNATFSSLTRLPASLSEQIGSAPFQAQLLSQTPSWPAHASKFTEEDGGTEGQRTCRKVDEGRGSRSEPEVGGERQASWPHASPARPECCLTHVVMAVSEINRVIPRRGCPRAEEGQVGIVTCGNRRPDLCAQKRRVLGPDGQFWEALSIPEVSAADPRSSPGYCEARRRRGPSFWCPLSLNFRHLIFEMYIN